MLAEANGGAAVNGALAAGGGELAAKYLGDYITSQNGGRLTLEQEQQVKALGQAVGAVAGGAGGAGIVGAALGTGIATNSIENNFLGKDDLARLRNLRNKAKGSSAMSSQEWTELILLDTADQMSAGLLRLALAGEALTEVQQADLYTFYQRYLAQNGSFDIDNLQGITPDTVYGFPYAGLSEDRKAYKEAHFTIWDDIVPLWRERTDNEKIYETGQRWSGLVPNQPQDLLPSTMQWREFFGLHDALTSSVLASAGYAAAHFAGASEENKRAIAQTIANIAAIGGTVQAGKTGLLPVTGSLGVPIKPEVMTESPQTNALVPRQGVSNSGARPTPSQTEVGAVDTVQMANRVTDIRRSLPSDLKRGGNVAIADVKVDGLPSSLAAHSGIENPTTAQKASGLVGKGEGVFDTFSVPNKSGVPIPRAGDSEAKIFENLALRLGENTKATGSVTIFTERPACGSCMWVIDQFVAKYPGIRVSVIDNKGVILRPRPVSP